MFILNRLNINHNQRQDPFRKLHCKLHCSFTHQTVTHENDSLQSIVVQKGNNILRHFLITHWRRKRHPLWFGASNILIWKFFQTSVQNCANCCLNKIIDAVLPYPGQNFQLERSIALMPSDRTGGSYFISNSLQKIDQRRGNFLRHHNITIRQIAQSNPSTSFK